MDSLQQVLALGGFFVFAVFLLRKKSEKKEEELMNQFLGQFSRLSAQALRSNNEAFMDLAKLRFDTLQTQAEGVFSAKKEAIEHLLSPLAKSLTEVDKKIAELEKARAGAYASLSDQLCLLTKAQAALSQETHKLSSALRAPVARGQWGEVQLKRVAELSGMLEYCDFTVQEGFDRGAQRPDMVVRLPNHRNVIVDAKVPLRAYLEASECNDDIARKAKLQQHAASLKSHVQELSAKSYWEQFDKMPEFVVLFLPGESFFSAALEGDPTLIEYGASQKVLVATPSTLIALLRAVAFGWQEQEMSDHAKEIALLGKQLHERLGQFGRHFDDVRKALDKSVESYNKAVGSFESRVMVSARKLAEMSVQEEHPPIDEIEKTTRALMSSGISEPQ